MDENDKPTRVYVVPVEEDAAGKRAVRALSPAKANVGDGDGSGDFDWSPDSRQIVFAHQPTPQGRRLDHGRTSRWWRWSRGRCGPLAATAAAESARCSRRTARSWPWS